MGGVGVHPHRAGALLVRGLSRRHRRPCALLRHGRLHNRCLPRGVPRRTAAAVRGSADTPLRPVRRLRSRRSVQSTTAGANSRRSAAGCTSACSAMRVTVDQPWIARRRSSRGAAHDRGRRSRTSPGLKVRAGRAARLASNGPVRWSRHLGHRPPPHGFKPNQATRICLRQTGTDTVPVFPQLQRARYCPTGCQTVLSSRKLAISHGLCPSPSRTTRLTLSAASRSSSALSPAAPVTSIAFTSR